METTTLSDELEKEIIQVLKEILQTLKRQVALFEQYDSEVFETEEFQRAAQTHNVRSQRRP